MVVLEALHTALRLETSDQATTHPPRKSHTLQLGRLSAVKFTLRQDESSSRLRIPCADPLPPETPPPSPPSGTIKVLKIYSGGLIPPLARPAKTRFRVLRVLRNMKLNKCDETLFLVMHFKRSLRPKNLVGPPT